MTRSEEESLLHWLDNLCLEQLQDVLSLELSDALFVEARKHLNLVKSALKERDYPAVFATPARVSVYAAQHVAARALCFRRIFEELPCMDVGQGPLLMACIGAGAGSELAAVVSSSTLKRHCSVEFAALDCAEAWLLWHQRLVNTIPHPCASLKAECRIVNVLESLPTELSSAHLITMCFVVNELFAENTKMATKLLAQLFSLPPLANGKRHILVVDSASSHVSHQTFVNGKKYPVHFMLDFMAKKGNWITLGSSDSSWCRIEEALHSSRPASLRSHFPMQNTHYFHRFYQQQ